MWVLQRRRRRRRRSLLPAVTKVEFWRRRTTGVQEVQGSAVLLQVVRPGPGTCLERSWMTEHKHVCPVLKMWRETVIKASPKSALYESVPSLERNMREGPIR